MRLAAYSTYDAPCTGGTACYSRGCGGKSQHNAVGNAQTFFALVSSIVLSGNFDTSDRKNRNLDYILCFLTVAPAAIGLALERYPTLWEDIRSQIGDGLYEDTFVRLFNGLSKLREAASKKRNALAVMRIQRERANKIGEWVQLRRGSISFGGSRTFAKRTLMRASTRERSARVVPVDIRDEEDERRGRRRAWR